MQTKQMPSLWYFATSDGTPGHAVIMGIVVGAILTVINQGDAIWTGGGVNYHKVVLTCLVPYCVATYGAVSAKRRAWQRENGKLL